jgi:peptidoglycan/LPS O-acetylase OafA/YrhL
VLDPVVGEPPASVNGESGATAKRDGVDSAERAEGAPLSQRHLPALDGVRGVAILAVLLVHLSWKTTDTVVDRAFTAIANCGWMGVDLFFVLSGFLITGILVDSQANPHYFRSFYGRRALRILPLYYAFVTFFVVILPLRHAPTVALHNLLDHQAWLWAHSVNIWATRDGLDTIPYSVGIAWSLSLEEQFYLFWPWVVRRASAAALMPICAGFVVGVFALRLAIAGRWPTAAYTLMPARMDAFAMGGFIALMLRRPGGRVRLERLSLPIGGCALAVVVGMYIVRGNMWTEDYGLGTVGYAAADWLSAAVLMAALTWAGGVFSNAVLRFFGKYSYATYLFHLPVATAMTSVTAWFLAQRGGPAARFGWMLGSLGVLIAATVGLSLVSWYLLEQPFLRLKRLFPYATASPRLGLSRAPRPS